MVISINKIGKKSEQEKDKKNKQRTGKRKSVVILGDSMVKHLNGWEMSKKIKNSRAT